MRVVSIALLALLACPGCWLAHDLEGEPMRVPPIADAGGPALLDSGGRPRRDGGPIGADASMPPLECAITRADATCLDSFLVEPMRPFVLPATFDECVCCGETECAVEVDPGSQTISLTTTLCPDPCDCATCNAAVAQCEVPGLAPGDWDVVVNGVPAFQLPVQFDSGFAPPAAACATYAEEDTCAPSAPLPGAPWSRSPVCAERRGAISALDVIMVTDSCWPCGNLHAPCVATLQPRFTDDLPPGGDLDIDVRDYATACDVDCPALCFERTRECIVPPLTDGDFYRVRIDGSIVDQFVQGSSEGGTPCARDAVTADR